MHWTELIVFLAKLMLRTLVWGCVFVLNISHCPLFALQWDRNDRQTRPPDHVRTCPVNDCYLTVANLTTLLLYLTTFHTKKPLKGFLKISDQSKNLNQFTSNYVSKILSLAVLLHCFPAIQPEVDQSVWSLSLLLQESWLACIMLS